MAVVQLNVLATGQDFAIDDSNIIEVIPINAGANSQIIYQELGRLQDPIDVIETASAVATASGTVFAVTAYTDDGLVSTVTRYLSAYQCEIIAEFTTYRQISYNYSGADLREINVSDTLANLILAINVTSSDFVTIAGAQTVTGAKTFSAATVFSSTVATGALTVTGAASTTTTLAAGTSLSVGTDQTFAKEVNHSVSVVASTTATAAGGNLAVSAGAGATSGAGGTGSLQGGAGGATGAGGVANVTSGDGGATSGASGAVNVKSGSATVGSSGTITVQSGDTASGVAGDVIIDTGSGTSTTVCPVISLNKGVVRKPASSSVASGATITGVELVKGLIAATGATGNWQLPAAADITTAIGSTPAGTYFDFVFNAAAMTATNTATLVVGAGMTVMSAAPITGGDTLTVTQDTQVVGHFRVTFDTPTTCKISRIA